MNSQIDASSLSAVRRLEVMRRVEAEIARNPRNADAFLALAELHSAQKNHAAAKAALMRALALRKKDPEILGRLVHACKDLNDLQEARKFARKGVEAAPRSARSHQTLAMVLERLGKPALAIESLSKADRLEPGSAQTLHDIGRCHGMAGDHAQALAWHEKALAADPHHAPSLYSWATGRKFAPEEVDAFLQRARTAAASPAVRNEPSLAANLRYAMGKALDDAGRFDEAFAECEAANALRKPADPLRALTPFQNAIEAFPRNFHASRAGWGLASDRPVFVIGLPRSGTTLTESLLGAHSQVTAGDELTFMNQIARELGRESDVSGAYRDAIERLDRKTVAALGERYLSAARTAAGDTPRFTDKLPHNFLNVGLIALLFPQAKIVHCRRHPMDNCFSLYSNSMSKFHNRYKSDLTRLGIYYRQYAQLMEHWKAALPGRIHDVFYEDLVVNTEHAARAMTGFLGLEWEDGVMRRDGAQQSVRTLSFWQVRQPVYQSSKGKWRAYERHLAPLAEAIGPYLERYEQELDALAAPTEQAS